MSVACLRGAAGWLTPLRPVCAASHACGCGCLSSLLSTGLAHLCTHRNPVIMNGTYCCILCSQS